MTSQGVAKETFKAGDAITIQAYPSKTPAAVNATQSRDLFSLYGISRKRSEGGSCS
jgi:hypothetical protein